MTLESIDQQGRTIFPNNGPIPQRFTCEGRETSPPLAWSGVPASAQSLVLIVEDADAVDENGYLLPAPWVHWVLYNIPPNATLLEGGPLPAGTLEGVNGRGQTGYVGPCPPEKTGRHRYFHKLLALRVVLPDLDRPSKDALLRYIRFKPEGELTRIVASVDLVGTYDAPP